jgi:4-amino-4-deoxy-L-arabinose transferase-like glycosyltransferase
MKTAARLGWVVLILATLFVCYFSHLGAIGFTGPDEPRYAWIARDMAETGDWVTPRLYGQPWFEKPVLYYWGAAASFRLFGVSEAAARLPSAVSALLATLALGWLAWRLYGALTARWVLLLLPSTAAMTGFSHAASTDMPFSGMLTIAMVCAAVLLGLTRNENSPVLLQSSWLAAGLFGVFLGLAVLAKGPAAIILSGGCVFFWALATRRWRDAFRCFHPLAVATFCLTALPWYILCARRNPDFFRVFIIEHNFKRFLTPEFQHIQPFWYYGPIIVVALFPWVGMALGAVIYSLRRRFGMSLDAQALYLLGWGGFTLLFFSISRSKLPGYVLPAIPAFLLLAARGLTNLLEMKKAPRPKLFAVLALTPVAAIGTMALAITFDWRGKSLHAYAMACAVLALLAITAVLTFTLSQKHSATLLSGLAAWLCLLGLTYQMAMPGLDSRLSPRMIANKVMNIPEAAENVSVFRLNRGWQYGLNYYLHRELHEWDGADSSGQYVISSLAGLAELKKKNVRYLFLEDVSTDPILIRIADSARRQQIQP